ncbi:unnamed protein product [Arabidopsis thaliana]|uniref:(thale cress) hypothetical protein n=1 Tax=Arabidopsis thaliana TaxID=3702 RepID=A0A7G2FC52_ARATH|nr:unnamed protein product [Arabidopsis thaliana]
MVSNQRVRLFMLCFCLVNNAVIAATEDENVERKPYIVYMGEATENSLVEAAENHHNLLMTVIGDESKARELKIYSYGKNINGFVARLFPHEAEKLSREEGVVSVFKNTQRQLHTTRSWDFLGLVESKYKRSVGIESNIIVGVLDTGIDVESPSFNDKGVGPPPAKWKGKCVTGNNFTRCNNKVIGAKYFHIQSEGLPDGEGDSAADHDGHGTHTSSTIAGVSVSSASLFGIANGTARGGVPSARIAAYKVCWDSGCTDMDMLAAFDEAISDGVDIISISIGGASLPFFEDPIAIGAFHAMKRGILTTCSAGNNGPGLFTVSNLAPWVMTVAANSLDRKFETVVKLGNGLTASGISLNGFNPRKKMYPLTSGSLASNLSAGGYGEPSTCEPGTLGEDKVMGKVVYCEAGREEGGNGGQGQDHVVRSLKGAGVIVQLLEPTDMATSTLIAGSYVFFEDATPMRIKGNEAELSYGSGQINPRRAIHPGLVYDITEDAYLRFLCKEGYNSTSIGLLTGDNSNNTTKKEYNCENIKRGLGSDGLNYPSLHKQVNSTEAKVSEVFYRTVTNVGYGPSTYVARVWAPKGLRVEVVPKVMSFERPKEKRNFKVVIDGVWDETMKGIVSASVEWDDSRGHLVRSPILLFRSDNDYR